MSTIFVEVHSLMTLEPRPLWGGGPGRKRVLEYLEVEKYTPDSHKFVTFEIYAANII